MVLDAALLNILHYKVRVKRRVDLSKEWSGALPYTSVLWLLKREPSGHPRLMSSNYCHNKTPDRKWGWSVDDVMPGWDGPENMRILKRVEIGLWRQRVEFPPLRDGVEFSTVAAAVRFFESRPVERNWDLKPHKIRRALAGVSIVRTVSLSSCHHGPKQRLIKSLVSWNNRACLCIEFVYVKYTTLFDI